MPVLPKRIAEHKSRKLPLKTKRSLNSKELFAYVFIVSVIIWFAFLVDDTFELSKRGYEERACIGNRVSEHRLFDETDLEHLAKVNGEVITNEQNPGVRVQPSFCSEEEERELIKELYSLVKQYGGPIHWVEHQIRADSGGQLVTTVQRPIVQRVTGEDEGEDQIVAPWGYGSHFNINKVPPLLRKYVNRILDGPYSLGPIRDITVNHYQMSNFGLEPHVDSPTDGAEIFLLGLMSPEILTLTPNIETTRDDFEVAKYSWTNNDIDIFFQSEKSHSFKWCCKNSMETWNKK